MVEKYFHSKAPFSLKTLEQRNLERVRMDIYFVMYLISFFSLPLLILLLISNINFPYLEYYFPFLFLFLFFAFVISLFKFTIKIFVVMLRTQRWGYLLLTIFTGSTWVFIFYFVLYRRFLTGKITLEELSLKTD